MLKTAVILITCISSVLLLPAQIQDKEAPGQEDKKIYRALEVMPEFPGGLDSLYDWIYSEIDYSDAAFKKGVDDMMFTQFVINEDGTVSEIEIVKGVSEGADRAIVKILKNQPVWKPGMLNGKAVKVYYSLPLQLDIAQTVHSLPIKTLYLRSMQVVYDGGPRERRFVEEVPEVLPPPMITCRTDTLVQKVDKKPEFPGGEQAFYRFLSEHLKYPGEALSAEAEGELYVDITVNRLGEVSNVTVCDSPSEFLNEEVKRVINMMPAWTPAEYKGNPAPVTLTLPITFRIQ